MKHEQIKKPNIVSKAAKIAALASFFIGSQPLTPAHGQEAKTTQNAPKKEKKGNIPAPPFVDEYDKFALNEFSTEYSEEEKSDIIKAFNEFRTWSKEVASEYFRLVRSANYRALSTQEKERCREQILKHINRTTDKLGMIQFELEGHGGAEKITPEMILKNIGRAEFMRMSTNPELNVNIPMTSEPKYFAVATLLMAIDK